MSSESIIFRHLDKVKLLGKKTIQEFNTQCRGCGLLGFNHMSSPCRKCGDQRFCRNVVVTYKKRWYGKGKIINIEERTKEMQKLIDERRLKFLSILSNNLMLDELIRGECNEVLWLDEMIKQSIKEMTIDKYWNKYFRELF